MFTFAIDYYLFVVAASLGVIQIAGSLGGLRGLLLFKRPGVARTGGLTVAVAAFIWFFASDVRNVNDFEGGLDANVQALLFFLGAVTAYIFTLIISTFANANMKYGQPAPGDGLEALKRMSYGRALAHSLRYWWREWRTLTKFYSSG